MLERFRRDPDGDGRGVDRGGVATEERTVAEHADDAAYELHVATPPGVELERVAALAELRYTAAGTHAEVCAAVAEPGLVEVRTNRARNVEVHREVFASVARNLA